MPVEIFAEDRDNLHLMYGFENKGQYIEGALRLLLFVEARRPTGRRFGPDADARWNSFRGDLQTVDRIELMIRDADAEWPASFAARVVYAVPGVPEDEPFGSQWGGLDAVDAEELWRRVKAEPPPNSPGAALKAIAAAWGRTLGVCPVGTVSPNDHLIVAGASAIAATIDAFVAGTALDWSEQVLVVASSPPERQLAAAATSLLNSQRSATILTAAEASATKPVRGARLVVSGDVDGTDRAAASALLGG